MAFRKSNLYLSLVNSYIIDSPQPSSINYWWNLGSLLGLCLVIQICTGIFLAMHYSSNIELAFSSVEHIMRDVQYGYLLRYMHANGASFFFLCLYIHIGKGLYYGSYRSPRIVLWTVGVIIFILTIAAAFLGYKNNNSLTSYINIKINEYKNTPYLKQVRKSWNRLNIINQKRNYQLLLYKNNYPITDKTLEEVLKELNIKLLYAWDNLEDNKVRSNIINTVKNKRGIYIIINKINNKFYIGSSINKLYTRLCKHLLNLNGNKYLKNSVKLYGLNNFIYGIIEIKNNTFITINNDLNLKEIYEELAYLETLYILTLLPQYNILQEAYSSKGYKHTPITIQKIKDSFLKERRNMLANLLANRKWLEESKKKLIQSNINKFVSKEIREKLSISSNKTVKLYDLNNKFLCDFKNISKARHYLCTSEKLISYCLKKGYIYIPNIFIFYLNNKFLSNNNYIKSFINKNDLEFINSRKKITQKKSGIISYNWNSKFYILNL